MKTRYNSKHLTLDLKKENEVYLRLYYNYSILDLFNRKLSQQRIDLFRVLAKIDQLIYRLQLSPIIRIYSVILVVQLESTVTTLAEEVSDSYKRRINSESSFITNKKESENNEFKIERIINKKITRSKLHYLL